MPTVGAEMRCVEASHEILYLTVHIESVHSPGERGRGGGGEDMLGSFQFTGDRWRFVHNLDPAPRSQHNGLEDIPNFEK